MKKIENKCLKFAHNILLRETEIILEGKLKIQHKSDDDQQNKYRMAKTVCRMGPAENQ